MSFDELYGHLEKFVHYLAHSKANGAFLMDHDEISGELFEEMVKGYQRYGHLPQDQLLKVVKKMMDNRISELTYKYYVTHRKYALKAVDLSGDVRECCSADVEEWAEKIMWTSCERGSNVDEFIDSKERVRQTFDALSGSAKKVLFALLYGCPNLTAQIELSGRRSSHVYKTPNREIKIKPWHVAEALLMDEKEVKQAFVEIKKTYAEVRNGV